MRVSPPSPYDPRVDYLVYVLLSESGQRTYVGITLDMGRRLEQHNGARPGGARSTRAGRPWNLAVTYGPYPNRAHAQRVEARLKKVRGMERLDRTAESLED